MLQFDNAKIPMITVNPSHLSLSKTNVSCCFMRLSVIILSYQRELVTFQLTLPIRVMKLMGIQMLIVTNAAGSVNPSFKAGDLMILKDHIFFPNFSGRNPLVGANDERFVEVFSIVSLCMRTACRTSNDFVFGRYGPRFPAMSDVYCRELRKIARDIAVTQNIDSFMREGVYVMFAGPSFETVAECRMLRALGGDVIGMCIPVIDLSCDYLYGATSCHQL